MLICQNSANLQPYITSHQDVNWTQDAEAYPSLEEMPAFISHHKQLSPQRVFNTTANPQNLQGKQLHAYTIVCQHTKANSPPPLRMIISGTAGTGKSYLIKCLRLLLNDQMCVAAPTGVAAFNIEGHTLHSLFSLPTKGEY